MKKSLVITMIIYFIIISIPQVSCAASSNKKSWTNKLSGLVRSTVSNTVQKSDESYNVNDWTPTENAEDYSKFNEKTGLILGRLTTIGSITSVLALVIIGIKYMLASNEEKAEYKEKFIFYVLGALLIFAISAITTSIYNFAKGL